MIPLLLVMLGGAAGAGARYGVGKLAVQLLGLDYPWGTLTVNLVGGLLMGLLAGGLARLSVPGEHWRLLLGVGVLGGFTTFSSFSLEVVGMMQRGALASALGYALLSVIGACVALYAGLLLVRVAA